MAIKTIKDYRHEQGAVSFVVDSDADFANLPKCDPGSTAVSPSGKVYRVNASGKWVEFGAEG